MNRVLIIFLLVVTFAGIACEQEGKTGREKPKGVMVPMEVVPIMASGIEAYKDGYRSSAKSSVVRGLGIDRQRNIAAIGINNNRVAQ